ncbi:hypothetical protein PUN28_008554 [Cardiocondyla obscurior]|uniref:Uncharacterized protein n=1 Tax=Cardiocondyla obscurior TaxID=286306 RepID=A0AAW2FY67_9HYME
MHTHIPLTDRLTICRLLSRKQIMPKAMTRDQSDFASHKCSYKVCKHRTARIKSSFAYTEYNFEFERKIISSSKITHREKEQKKSTTNCVSDI